MAIKMMIQYPNSGVKIFEFEEWVSVVNMKRTCEIMQYPFIIVEEEIPEWASHHQKYEGESAHGI